MLWLLYARFAFLAALMGVTTLCVWVELSGRNGDG
jgi:hypothetical protein